MTPKQFALLALVAWLAVAGWIGSMILAKPAALSRAGSDMDTGTAMRIEADLRRTDQARTTLAALVAAPVRVAGPSIIALPPARGVGAAALGAASGEDALAPGAPPARTLAFIVSGRDLRPRAMIDGALVGAGARLPDGAIVRHIGARAVRIEDGEGQMHTLVLRTPGEAGATAGDGR